MKSSDSTSTTGDTTESDDTPKESQENPTPSQSDKGKLQDRKKESYKLFDEIAGTYDFLNKLLSCGIDVYWRVKIRKKLPQKNNLEVLDLATGTADVPLTLSSDSKVQHIHGIDLSQKMIRKGREKVKGANLQGMITLDLGDGVHIPAREATYDVVTISFGIRNFPDPQTSLNNAYRVLRPGGRIIITEFALPKRPLMRKLYFFYFRKLLPKIGNLLSRHPDAYSYLNESVESFPYGEDFVSMLKEAGFVRARYELMTCGIAALYVGEKPSENEV